MSTTRLIQKHNLSSISEMGTANYKYVGEYVKSQFERGRNALEEGVYDRAIELFTSALRGRGMSREIEADIRCSLSEAYEEDTNGKEALEVVSKYESLSERESLPQLLQASVWLRMGMAYARLANHPKAISYLNTSLKIAQTMNSPMAIGEAHLALGRSYFKVDEYNIAHDHLDQASDYFRQVGDRRRLAQSCLANGNVLLREGKHDEATVMLESAERLISDRPYFSLLAQILQNRAVIYGVRYRCREALPYEERSIEFFERAGQRRSLIRGLNNLGVYSFFLGEIERAQSEWERASELAKELGYGLAEANALDGLAQIDILHGHYSAAERKLETALTIVDSMNSKWYEALVRPSLVKLFCQRGDFNRALTEAEILVPLAEQIGDEHGVQLSKLLLAEAKILNNAFVEADSIIESVEKTLAVGGDLMLVGLSRRLRSRIFAWRDQNEEAIAEAAQSVSAFEALSNKFQVALSQYEWGKALWKAGNQASAREVLERSRNSFMDLRAEADLNRVNELLRTCEQHSEPVVVPSSFSLKNAERLLNAVVARELLLHELVSILHELPDVRRSAVFEISNAGTGGPAPVALEGWTRDEAHRMLGAVRQNPSFVSPDGNTRLHWLETGKDNASERAAVLIETATGVTSEQIHLLLKLAQQGLELGQLRRELSPKLAEAATVGNEVANSVGLVIGSAAMKLVLEAIHRIRSSDVTVLITGESGTGKELVARAVHAESARRERAFVPFNCTTATRDLADSLLFGHRKGAFTGAAEDRLGVVRAADGGTLFLDEIGDLAYEVQPKLLRFLQEGEAQPLGMERPIKVDVRVVAATNAELEQLVEQGRFREDLFHRLNVIRLRVPALRERREEVPILARHFLSRFAQESRKRLGLSDEATDLLQVFDWPGNVRQLSNEMRRVAALAEDGATITHQHLSPEIVGRAQSAVQSTVHNAIVDSNGITIDVRQPMSDAVSQLEREMLLNALKQNKGNISKTARQLGLTRRGLHMKRERLGIQDLASGGTALDG